ncbi:hypothetical protein [Streptodolium elevatio]|uniref:Transcriptional regulator n=1 Tax=Streptodolium elevatio TaxID=3157996 RepID=A0ABV3DBS9_9ACTN
MSGTSIADVMPRLLVKPEMIAACQRRDFSVVFAVIKSSGISASAIARACELTPNRVSDVINSRHAIEKLAVIERIADGIRIPGRMLGLADRAWEGALPDASSGSGVSLVWDPRQVTDMVRRYTRSDLVMDRRTAAVAVLAGSLGPTLVESLERWLRDDPKEQWSGRARGVGEDEVSQLEHAARVFRQWDHQFGGGIHRKAVVGQLSEVADLLKVPHPRRIQRRLYAVMAELAGSAATMSWDCGMQKTAQDYYLMAVQSAKAAGDRPYGAKVLAGLARQYLYLDRANDALDIIRLARDGAQGHATPAVMSMLHTREAWAYAKLGRVEAFRRATATAEDTFANAVATDEPHWIAYYGEAEIAGVTGGRWLELARFDPKYAEPARRNITQAIETRGRTGLRSLALDRIGLAEVLFIQGDHSAGVRAASGAMDVAEHTQSGRVVEQLRGLYGYTAARASYPGIRDLRDRMRDLLTA